MKLGLVTNSNKEYHEGDGLSSSQLREINKSTLHAVHRRQIQPTKALEFGSAAHKWILEEEDFYSEFAVMQISRRTKAGKEKAEELASQDIVVITDDDFEKIQGMKQALVPEALDLLNGAVVEQSVYWNKDDVLCKCRPDAMQVKTEFDQSSVALIDYKTTQSCEPKEFMRSCRNYQYEMQLAWYVEGLKSINYQVNDIYIIAQEKMFPFANKVYKLTDATIQSGNFNNQEAFAKYKRYLKTEVPECYNAPNVLTLDYESFQ